VTGRPQRARWTAVVVVATMIGLSGCGVPSDKSPSAIPRHDVPFGLLQPSSKTTTSTAPSPVAVTVQVFLVGPTGHLVKVARQVPASPDSLETALDALARGPTNVEAAAGLQSAVPAQTVVLGATVATDGVATVNLGGTFGELVGQAQIEASAQIVFTATFLPGVTGVTFELEGQPGSVSVASGEQVPTATPAQFAPLAPLPTG
jgi:hypothetical protein